jgi:hypothetical protein
MTLAGQRTGVRRRTEAGAVVDSKAEAVAELMLEAARSPVPQIAQMRPTSRQRMQRLADVLAAERLVESAATSSRNSAASPSSVTGFTSPAASS